MQRLDQPAPRVAGPRDLLRRLTRWFNLTVLHQALWPAIVLVSGSVLHDTGVSPWGDLAGLVIGPLLAVLFALIYLRSTIRQMPALPVTGTLAENTRIGIIALPFMVLGARMLNGDAEATFKIALVGALSVAAYHLIHFGIVQTVFERRPVVVGLFGLSWAIHQIAESLARDSGDSLILGGLGGFSAGVLVASTALLVHRWPGGRFTAPALHWLIIYLIFGFAS